MTPEHIVVFEVVTDPEELPLYESVPRCMGCDYHDNVAWQGDNPYTDLVPRGQSMVYEGAGEVAGPHFCRRCQYCGFRWPEALVPR